MFHEKRLKMHRDFRLILILRDAHTKLSKFLLEKVTLINNDLTHEDLWKEMVGDMLINYCYPVEKEMQINKYFKEKLFSDANEEFNLLCVKCAKQEELVMLDLNFVEEHETMIKEPQKEISCCWRDRRHE